MNVRLIVGALFLNLCANVNVNAKTLTDVYGWLDSVTVTQNNILLGQAIGKTDRFSNINLHVAGLASASEGSLNCALLILEKTEPYVAGSPQNKLNSSSLKNIFDAYSGYTKGQFIKLINLQVIDYSNQTFCLASSVEPQQSNTKTTAKFVAESGFVGTLYDSVDRWKDQGPNFKFFYAPDAPGSPRQKYAAVYSPIHYGCIRFRWPTDEYAAATKKEFDQYIQSNSFDQFVKAGIEMVGVRPINENGLCIFEQVKLLSANEKNQSKKQKAISMQIINLIIPLALT